MNDFAYHLWSRVGGDRFNRGDEWGTYPRTAEFLRRLVAAYKKSRERAVAIRELSRLTDRQLADIGIAREQIRDAVDGLVARHGSAPEHVHTAAPKLNAAPCTS